MLIQAIIQHFIEIYQKLWPASTKEFWLRESVKMAPPLNFELFMPSVHCKGELVNFNKVL